MTMLDPDLDKAEGKELDKAEDKAFAQTAKTMRTQRRTEQDKRII